MNAELCWTFLPLRSTQLNIHVLDKVWGLQGGVCPPVGGRLESMAYGSSAGDAADVIGSSPLAFPCNRWITKSQRMISEPVTSQVSLQQFAATFVKETEL